MRILITNDDGYQSKGIKVLADIMKQYGEVTVIAPKSHQSGMSMAVSLGFKQIAHKDLGNGWHYVDATPASCVKFGLNTGAELTREAKMVRSHRGKALAKLLAEVEERGL